MTTCTTNLKNAGSGMYIVCFINMSSIQDKNVLCIYISRGEKEHVYSNERQDCVRSGYHVSLTNKEKNEYEQD